ncbi:hypothetical protein C5167_005643 [Papaver somniferum]|uniref:Uncharacterized protein n=1 Tax=Papaver somniferum TaxID=3469 RepID=A0A4Y7JF12_PAPSO|nr:uncharacterized protein LOC113275650 isoform X2 [Papaver somniferum]RZC58339.1 hypothetical protein C5167_005643 [Papaver somniferum]
MQMNTQYMSSSSIGMWQIARQEMKEYLNQLLPRYPESAIDDFNDKLMSNAGSIAEYMDQDTVLRRVMWINAGNSLPPPTHGMHADNYDYDSGDNGFRESMDNWPPHSNYYGQNSTSLLQNDGMVPIPPNFGNTSALQQQQPNYSFDGQFGSMERSYFDSQKPIFLDTSTHGRIDGGRSSFGATQIGNSVGSVGRSLGDLDQTYAHLGGMNHFPMGTSQGNLQGMLQNTAAPYPTVPTPYPSYTPTEQPSKVQRSYKTGKTRRHQQPLQQTHRTTKSAKHGVTPRSNEVFGSSQITGCESKCEYCGKNPTLVDYFMKRTVKSFRDQHPKLCKKLDTLYEHLRKCNKQKCGCSKFRPYHQHAVDRLRDGLKELQISQKISPHSLKGTWEISDVGDGGEVSRKTMKVDGGFGPARASVDQIASQVELSQMGVLNETVMDSTWDWSANSIDNFCALPMSLDDHAQGVKTVKLKTDGASQSESLSPVQTPHSSITQEVNQEPLQADSSIGD